MKTTHFIVGGDLDAAQPYLEIAKKKNRLYQQLEKLSLLPHENTFIHTIKHFEEGRFIRQLKINDLNIVNVEVPPLVEPYMPAMNEELLYPPACHVCESFYVVYDEIEPQMGSYSSLPYTGEHIAGHFIPPYHDAEFDARKGFVTYTAFDGIVATAADPNAPLTPHNKRQFGREVKYYTNYDQFTYTNNYHATRYIIVNHNGLAIGAWRFITNDAYIQAPNGSTVVSHSWDNNGNAAGSPSWPYDATIIIYCDYNPFLPLPRSSGIYLGDESGFIDLPDDDGTGEECAGIRILNMGGAYSEESDSYFCVWNETDNTDTDEFLPDRFMYRFVFRGGAAEESGIYEEEYEDWYTISINVTTLKIYEAEGCTFAFFAYSKWDEFTDQWSFHYWIIKCDADNVVTKFESHYDPSDYWGHEVTDFNGQTIITAGNFRLVRDTMEYLYRGGKTMNLHEMNVIFQEFYKTHFRFGRSPL